MGAGSEVALVVGMIERRLSCSRLIAAGLLSLLMSTLQACSSTGDPGSDAATGTGGFTGDGLGGNGADGSTPDVVRDALLDAAPPGTPFSCGDGALTCATGETYCRRIGGQRLPDGGQYPTRYDCAPFKSNCSPLDCSCILPNPGDVYCYACEQQPSGAVIAQCGPV